MSPSPDAVRVAIAGAASLRGKELKQLLEESNFPASEIRLLDEEIAAGTLTEAGGEPAVIETVDEDSFERVRFAVFTGSPGFSVRHGVEARRAGATVIDLSGGLSVESGARLWIPALDGALASADAKAAPGEPCSLFLAPSAPADVAISLCGAFASMGLNRLVLTFFQPVSETGWKNVRTSRLSPMEANAPHREIATSAGADGARNRLHGSPGAAFASADASAPSSAGIHNRAPDSTLKPPLRSITVAPARRASTPCRTENPGEPVKKAKRTRSKLSSSTVSLPPGSPPAPVRLPDTTSSSNNRIPPARKFASSSKCF